MVGGVELIERELEQDRLSELLDAACDGTGSALSVRGAAGIGKTSLLRVAAELAGRRGMTVLSARGSELELDFPFGVTRQLIERRVVTAPEDERARLLDGAAALAGPAIGLSADPGLQPEPSFGLLHGLYWLVANLCLEGPTLIAVDDTQWADVASLRFLAHLVRRLEDLPLLALLARRAGEPASDERMMTLLEGVLADAPEVPVIVPGPLSESGTARLLARELDQVPGPDLVARCHTETGGNPFLLVELVRSLRSGESVSTRAQTERDGVSRSILLRLGRLGQDVIDLAQAVGILGDDCTLGEATVLAGLEPAAAAAAADALMQAEILAPQTELRFVHPLVRAAVESEMTPARRAARHREAATVLIRRGAADERVISQLLSSGPTGDADVVRRLRAAGEDAMSKAAPAAAARYIRRALDEPPPPEQRGELLAMLGTALALSEQPDQAIPVLRQARELAEGPVMLAERTSRLWLAMLGVGAITDGLAMLEATIERIDDPASDPALRLEREFFSAALYTPERVNEIWDRLARRQGLQGTTPAQRALLSVVGTVLRFRGTTSADVCGKLARLAYRDGALVDEQALVPTKWIWGIALLIFTDQCEAAEAGLERALDTARTTGSVDALLATLNMRALLRTRQGQLAEADTDAVVALDRIAEVERSPAREVWRLHQIRWLLPVLIDRGELTRAEKMLSGHQLDGELPAGWYHARLYCERALLRLAQGRTEEALADALALKARDERFGIAGVSEGPWRPVAALALARRGDVEEAIVIADEHLDLARVWNLPRDMGVALRTRAQVEPDPRERAVLLERALSVLRQAPAPIEAARTRAELGIALLRHGKRTEGKEQLTGALDVAARCGATAIVEDVHAELRVAGARPRKLMFSGIEGLTASERRVAEMASEGMTNRQIAQALFVTLKTVEGHLRHAYRKLDITSRDELPNALGDADRQSVPASA